MASTDKETGLMTLLAAGTTASPAPPSMTDATLGASMPFAADQVTILLRSTAGTGALTASVRLWGFCVAANRWYNLGLLNAGVLIAEADTDLLSHVETVAGLRRFIRLYAEVDAALGGAATAVEVLAYPVRASAVSH